MVHRVRMRDDALLNSDAHMMVERHPDAGAELLGGLEVGPGDLTVEVEVARMVRL